jgi:hypothetical protein
VPRFVGASAAFTAKTKLPAKALGVGAIVVGFNFDQQIETLVDVCAPLALGSVRSDQLSITKGEL